MPSQVNCICGDLLGVTVYQSEEKAANLQVSHCQNHHQRLRALDHEQKN